MNEKVKANERAAMRVSRVGICVDALLTAFKFFAGIAGNSSAMLADAMHSFSDPDKLEFNLCLTRRQCLRNI